MEKTDKSRSVPRPNRRVTRTTVAPSTCYPVDRVTVDGTEDDEVR